MKAIFIVPYFGKFPAWFEFWLISCSWNKGFYWLVISDNLQPSSLPPNVFYINTTFFAFKKRIQDKFDFPICLDKPYKICDFRPAFGYIFQDEISGYDYWGYCDVDLFWGHIESFMCLEKLASYQKIGDYGHFSLIKNSEEMRMIFTRKMEGCMYYRDVFTTERSCIFDENGTNNNGFAEICRSCGIMEFVDHTFFSDIKIRNYALSKNLLPGIARRHHELFLISDEKVVEYYLDSNGDLREEEQMYVHFQKRSPLVLAQNKDTFLLVPPAKIIDVPADFKSAIKNLAPENLRTKFIDLLTAIKRVPRVVKMYSFHLLGKILIFLHLRKKKSISW